jgi:hypothetical protein
MAVVCITSYVLRVLELFHAVNDGGDSAAARTRVAELELLDRVRFRNVFYEEVAADLKARGGRRTPALWDGEKLVEGRDAVLAALALLAK